MSNFVSTLKYGVPFLSFVVLGSFLLREFASIRYELHSYKRKYGTQRHNDSFEFEENESERESTTPTNSGSEFNQTTADMKNSGRRRDTAKSASQNAESDEIRKLEKLGTTEWQNIRGPRPWENNRDYDQLLERLRDKKNSATTTAATDKN